MARPLIDGNRTSITPIPQPPQERRVAMRVLLRSAADCVERSNACLDEAREVILDTRARIAASGWLRQHGHAASARIREWARHPLNSAEARRFLYRSAEAADDILRQRGRAADQARKDGAPGAD